MARREERIISIYTNDEQRSQTGWIGVPKCEVILARTLSATVALMHQANIRPPTRQSRVKRLEQLVPRCRRGCNRARHPNPSLCISTTPVGRTATRRSARHFTPVPRRQTPLIRLVFACSSSATLHPESIGSHSPILMGNFGRVGGRHVVSFRLLGRICGSLTALDSRNSFIVL